jgi:hypothetical protein
VHLPGSGRCGRGIRSLVVLVGGVLSLCLSVPPPVQGGPLTLTITGSVSFPDQSPDIVPMIGPRNITVLVDARATPGTPWVLTMIADSDLTSGTDVIPIGNVSWTASPSPPFRGGTLSTVVPAVLGNGVSHFTSSATLGFYLQNSWAYVPGTYTATATVTLSSP